MAHPRGQFCKHLRNDRDQFVIVHANPLGSNLCPDNGRLTLGTKSSGTKEIPLVGDPM
jgi:hypothetical protein